MTPAVDHLQGARSDTSAAVAISAPPDDLVEVGAIVEAYGLQGWVRVLPYARLDASRVGADSEASGGALLGARTWWLGASRESPTGAEGEAWQADPAKSRARSTPVAVLRAKAHAGAVVARLAHCDDRNAAQALRGWHVYVRRADFPALSDGEFYWVDLIGLEVVSMRSGALLGVVAGLLDNGAQSVLQMMRTDAPAGGAAQTPHRRRDSGQYTAPGTIRRETPPGKARHKTHLIPFVEAYVQNVDLAARRIMVDWDLDF